jgi:glycosyl transferase family 9 (putative heptosyltransferase)
VTPDLVVLRALGLGDLLTGVPALRALAREVPGRRVLLTPRALAPIAEPLGYEILDLHGVHNVPHSLPAEAAGTALAVNLHGRGPESHAVLADLQPSRLLAFACDSHDGPAWDEDEHEVARWCRLLASAGIDADAADLAIDAPAAEPAPGSHDATIIHPGAASRARCWPAERWARVIAAERDAGRRVIVTGGADERVRARWIAATSGLDDADVLAGRTSVSELAATIAVAGRVVCGDTGVAHLATALGTPSVVLFGPTSPARWGPPADRAIHQVLWAGRTGDPHASRPDPGLLEIGEGEVLQALTRLPVDGTDDFRPIPTHVG